MEKKIWKKKLEIKIGKFFDNPRPPVCVHRPFGLAVSLALENLYTNVLFYYIDNGWTKIVEMF